MQTNLHISDKSHFEIDADVTIYLVLRNYFWTHDKILPNYTPRNMCPWQTANNISAGLTDIHLRTARLLVSQAINNVSKAVTT